MHPAPRSLIRALPALGLLLLAVPAWAAFTDNGDGTVTDSVTGLMWDKCSWNQPWTGPASNTCDGPPTTYPWAGALDRSVYANSVNHRGYDDWRLPNKNELESLVDITVTAPAIDETAFPETPNFQYWSSTTYAFNPAANAWIVSFTNALTSATPMGGYFYVRLVRSGQSFDSYDLLQADYTITTATNPPAGGTVTCDPNPVAYDGTSTCTAAPSAGYSLVDWSGDCTGATCTLTNVTAPKTVTANFTLNTYAITTAANPPAGGTVTCDPNPVPYDGTSNCTAAPSTGYSFVEWSGDCTGATCTLTNVTAPQRVTANFQQAAPIPAIGLSGLGLLASLLAGWGGLHLRRRVHR